MTISKYTHTLSNVFEVIYHRVWQIKTIELEARVYVNNFV